MADCGKNCTSRAITSSHGETGIRLLPINFGQLSTISLRPIIRPEQRQRSTNSRAPFPAVVAQRHHLPAWNSTPPPGKARPPSFHRPALNNVHASDKRTAFKATLVSSARASGRARSAPLPLCSPGKDNRQESQERPAMKLQTSSPEMLALPGRLFRKPPAIRPQSQMTSSPEWVPPVPTSTKLTALWRKIAGREWNQCGRRRICWRQSTELASGSQLDFGSVA